MVNIGTKLEVSYLSLDVDLLHRFYMPLRSQGLVLVSVVAVDLVSRGYKTKTHLGQSVIVRVHVPDE